MMLFSRKTDYALLILSHLHAHPEGATARSLAESFGLSRAFVANILKELCQKGFLASHRGVKGGYALLRPADCITVGDIFEALEDGFRLASCTNHELGHLADEDCVVEHRCPIKGPIRELHRRIIDVLNTMKLSDLIHQPQAEKTLPQDLFPLRLREPVSAQVSG